MTASTARFGSDHENIRSEDDPLLRGTGLFTDDVKIDGQLHAVFVRAPVGHAEIRGIDIQTAAALPGVACILTGNDVAAAGLGAIPTAIPFKGKNDTPLVHAPMPVLALGKVRYAGEPVAIAVAQTVQQAADAAEAVVLDLDILPAASDVARATADGAAQIWPDAPGNIALDWEDGDKAATDAAFAAAAHIARIRMADTRLAPTSMEPRAGIASWDPAAEQFTLIAATQGVALMSKTLAEKVFNIDPAAVRVITHDVGGGFGMKVQPYPEYAAIMLAAKQTGKPVSWCNSRLESFLSDTHGRDGILEAEMAFDAAGKILALRFRNKVGMGPYISTFGPVFATNNTKNCLSSVYTIPHVHTDVKMVFTNAAPLGPYRGAGRPEAIIVIERLLDIAARATGLDPITLRRRNMIAPAAMPYQTAVGPIYDSGEFEAVMDKALALADWNGFPARKAQSKAAGKLRGIGIGCFLEVAGGILNETVDLRFEEDDTVTLRLGVQAMGQSHLTTFTRLVAERLGVPPSKVRLIEGDSAEAPLGWPSVASRSTMMAGSATHIACEEAVEKGRALAGHILEASSEDIEFADGAFRVAGTDREIGILDIAKQIHSLSNVPAELVGGMDTVGEFVSPQMSFPNGCHICEVEIDPQTGIVSVVGYTAVDDVGNVLDDTIVEGQIHGGIAQGLGQVLGEQVIYDTDGQMLTGSFMDYTMPRAGDLPDLRIAHHIVPCTTNPLGVKGSGESGVAGALPSALNAVHDALADAGIGHFELPASPARVWAALQAKPAA